jgi:hypothetical protein
MITMRITPRVIAIAVPAFLAGVSRRWKSDVVVEFVLRGRMMGSMSMGYGYILEMADD